VAIGLDTRVASPDSTYDARAPLKMGYRTIHDYHGTNRILTLREVFKPLLEHRHRPAGARHRQ